MNRKLNKLQIDEILADVVLSGGDFAEPEKVYRRVLGEKEKIYGSDHPEVARTLANLALTLFYMNRNSESDDLLGRAERILAAVRIMDEAVIGAKSVLAKLYVLKGDMSRAEAEYEDVIDFIERTGACGSEPLMDPLLHLGAVYFKTGKFALAEQCWKRVPGICASVRLFLRR